MLPRIIFVLCLCLLSFFYGAASIYFKIFPYPVLRDAKVGFDAWREVMEDDQNFEFIDENGHPKPHIAQFNGAEDDHSNILLAGHAYTFVSECPQLGCMALIMNRQGKVVHTWEVDLGQLWEDTPNHTGFKSHEDIATGGLHLYDNGDLLANFVSRRTFPFGIGMAKFDKDGDVLWQRANFSHHWFSVASDGLIYTPAHRLVDSPLFLGDTKEALNCDAGKIYADVILVVNPNGDTVAEISVLDLLIEQGFIGLLLGVDGCDPIHLNYVEYVTGDAARDTRGLLEGDLVISTLEQNMIAAIDGTTRKLKWVLAGKTARQHSPRLLADGSIIAFDNKGGKRQSGGSRLVRIEYGSDVVAEVFPRSDGDAGINFYTENAGHIDPHPDGTRALVSLTRQGRVLEIDLQHGRVLWELINTHDPGRYADQVGADQGQVVRFSATGAYYVDERVLESLVD